MREFRLTRIAVVVIIADLLNFCMILNESLVKIIQFRNVCQRLNFRMIEPLEFEALT